MLSVTSELAPTTLSAPILALLSTVLPMPINAFVADRAAMQHDLVTDGYAGADRQRHTRVHVQHAAVLHVAAVANDYAVVVGPQRGAEPDTGLRAQRDIADQCRGSAMK